ncbi:hypothetical protein NUSPORA_00143 [Nucleospora cyclopteri]
MEKAALSKSYALAAILVHASCQEVTADKIQKIFNVLELDFSSKLASKFALPTSKYIDLLSCPGIAVAPGAAGATNDAQAEAEEEVKQEESSDADLDF